MSMLAEPRRKQKWTLNPRGKHWSDDSNKFGQKMLEKMGWTSGKGLGAKEQGMTDHVRVAVKNDTVGIGYKNDDTDKAWTEHQEGFNEFLQTLQQNQDSVAAPPEDITKTLSGKSLEMKSKQSRARVHYRKFTRGKDVNKYSTKDLANIFGQKDLNAKSVTEDESNDVENSDPMEANRGGLITINGGNMAEYFQKKGRNFPATPKRNTRTTDSESEPEYVGFGFAQSKSLNTEETKVRETPCKYAFENPCLRLNSPENPSDGESKPSKKRKSDPLDSNEPGSKKLKQESNLTGFVNAALNLEDQSKEVPNGKEFEVSRAQFGLSNCALDLTDEIEDKKRVTFNDHVEYSTDSVKKKKKEKARLDRFEVENKKHKRKRKLENISNVVPVASGFVNEALDFEEVSVEVNDNEANERKSRKAKKRKECRRSNLETIVETPEEDKEILETSAETNCLMESTLECCDENLSKKGKKKKAEEVIEEETVSENKNEAEKIESTKEEKMKIEKVELNELTPEKSSGEGKKKKKKSKSSVDSSVEEHQETVKLQVEAAEESKNTDDPVTVKPKKKKKKKDKNQEESAERSINEAKEDTDIRNNEQEVNEEKPKKDEKENNCTKNVECVTEVSVVSAEETKSPLVPAEKNNGANNQMFNATRNPWNERARMSKRLLRSLFHRNSSVHFPGSNIGDIRGYGEDME